MKDTETGDYHRGNAQEQPPKSRKRTNDHLRIGDVDLNLILQRSDGKTILCRAHGQNCIDVNVEIFLPGALSRDRPPPLNGRALSRDLFLRARRIDFKIETMERRFKMLRPFSLLRFASAGSALEGLTDILTGRGLKREHNRERFLNIG